MNCFLCGAVRSPDSPTPWIAIGTPDGLKLICEKHLPADGHIAAAIDALALYVRKKVTEERQEKEGKEQAA